MPKNLQLYVLAVMLLAIAALWQLLPFVNFRSTEELLLFFALIALASMFPIPDPRGGFITAAGILFYVLISLHGPGAGLIVAGPGYAVGAAVSRKWIPWRILFNGAQMGLSVMAAGLAFGLSGGDPKDPNVRTLLVPLAISVLTFQLINNLFVAFYFYQLRGSPFLSTWFSDVKDLLVSNLLSIPTAALLVILYAAVGPLILLVYLVSFPLQRRAHMLYFQQKRIYDQAINALVLAIDANFPQGRGHSKRVASIATAVAREMDLPESLVETIELAALLHDVGLIGIESADGAEDQSELSRRFREHTRLGAELVRELPRKDVAPIILHHHERYDGGGYPQGLSGSAIPLGARIVAVAEVFDSLVSGGLPGKSPRSMEAALNEIKSEVWRAFDPRVVEALVRVIESGSMSQAGHVAESYGLGTLAKETEI